MKKILFIGKAPPIQGGVSINSLLAAISLVGLGYEVHFLSNRLGVEEEYKQVGGRSFEEIPNLIFVDILTENNLFHIPYSALYAERLTGRALSLLENNNYSLVVGWYLLPYGFAATIASVSMNIPFVLLHAGSDLNRLAENKDIASTIKYCLKQAKAVITPSSDLSVNRLVDLGAPRSSIVTYTKGIPVDLQVGDGASGSLFDILKDVLEESSSHGIFGLDWNSINSEGMKRSETLLTAICYGKLSKSRKPSYLFKLIYDIVKLNNKFRVIFVLSGDQKQIKQLQGLVKQAEISRNVIFTPPVAPHILVGLLKSCDIGLCIEEDFDVALHLSRVPRELMYYGVIPLVSKSFLSQPFYKDVLLPRKNCIVIDENFTPNVISDLIESSEKLEELKHGVDISSRYIEGSVGTINPISIIIARYAEG